MSAIDWDYLDALNVYWRLSPPLCCTNKEINENLLLDSYALNFEILKGGRNMADVNRKYDILKNKVIKILKHKFNR